LKIKEIMINTANMVTETNTKLQNIVEFKTIYSHGRPQTFFQGGGAKTYFLPKKQKKDTIFLKKVQKHTIPYKRE
jgi:hypothetical protein